MNPSAVIICEKCGSQTVLGDYVEVRDQHGKVFGKWAMLHRDTQQHQPGILLKAITGVCGSCGGAVSWTPMDKMIDRIKDYVSKTTV